MEKYNIQFLKMKANVDFSETTLEGQRVKGRISTIPTQA
jgi:hypothetical protein